MTKPIAVCTADWHLDQANRGAWRRRPEIIGDSFFALRQIVDICLRYEVPLLAAGDLLDVYEQDGPGAVAFANEQLFRLAGHGVYYIQGQHEMVRGNPWLSLTMATHLAGTYTHLGDIEVYGMDYAKPDALEAAFARIPDTANVLMCHQVWTDFMGKHIGGECSFSQVPHAQVMLTGDYHIHGHVRAKGASGQDLLVLSPGSTHMRSIDESPEKAVYVLYDDLKIESVPLKTRAVYRCGCYTRDELDYLVDVVMSGLPSPVPGLPTEIEKPLLHVTFDPDVPNTYQRLSQASDGRFHLFLTSRRIADLYAGKDEKPQSEGVKTIVLGLAGNLNKYFQERSDEHSLAMRLLQSGSPKEALAEYGDSYMNGA